MNNYLKTIAAALTAGAAIINTVLSRDTGGITPADWQNIVSVALGPLLVWLVPNLPSWLHPAPKPEVKPEP